MSVDRVLLAPNYHIADYNLYYLSIRNNVQERIKSFGIPIP